MLAGVPAIGLIAAASAVTNAMEREYWPVPRGTAEGFFEDAIAGRYHCVTADRPETGCKCADRVL